jgi:imidazolonepropionase-like amidohydrolase
MAMSSTAPRFLACAAGLLSATTARAQDAGATVFTGVSVLTMESNDVLHEQAVVVQGGEITWVGPTGELEAPADAIRIDGGGRWLMPGLADMHVHMDASDIPLFLANGVTTVREMNGSERHLALRDSIAQGLRLGPRMIVASALLAGEPQRWRHELIEDAQAAYAIAHGAAERGYSYLKVYDGLSKSAYLALAEASTTLGLPLTGHIPRAVGLDGVLEAGQASIEHTEQIMYATVGHLPDPSRLPDIAAQIADTDTWVTPTLAAQRMLSLNRIPAYNERLQRPEMRFMDAGLMGWWASLAAPEGAAEPGPDDPRRRRAEAFYGFQRDLALALHDAGVPLLIGTDTPNPLLVPGYSIHLELATLAHAGIPVMEVLRAATTGAAVFTGDEATRGVVRAGAAADLVLLDEDPRDDLITLEHPLGVMVLGRWLDRPTLDRMLEGAEQKGGE